MRKLPLIAAVASALGALPAFADRCDDDWRYLHVDNSHYYRGGVCRDVTIREVMSPLDRLMPLRSKKDETKDATKQETNNETKAEPPT